MAKDLQDEVLISAEAKRLAERYTGKSGREKTTPPLQSCCWVTAYSYEVFLYFLSLGSRPFYDLEIDAIL